MEPYDDKTNYCGAKGKKISKLVARSILAVDVNRCCYLHDQDYENQMVRDKADNVFWTRMRECVMEAYPDWYDPRRHVALLMAKRRFQIVRLFGGSAYKRAIRNARNDV